MGDGGRDRWIDGWRDGLTDGLTDGQTDELYQGVSPGQASLEGTLNVNTLLPQISLRAMAPDAAFPPPLTPRPPLALRQNQSHGETSPEIPTQGEKSHCRLPPLCAGWFTQTTAPTSHLLRLLH